MRSQHLAMSPEEFYRLPHQPGWKYEYYGGEAHIRPGHHVVFCTIPVDDRPAFAPCLLREPVASDSALLAAAFSESFLETVEYCDWEEDAVRKSSVDCIDGFFAGKRGRPHAASRIAVSDEADLAGAAMVVRPVSGPMLDFLFVRPAWQRRGIATALVSSVLAGLQAAGEASLRSSYHLCNQASMAWHQDFGFQEEPDLILARSRYRCAAYELARREELGDLDEAEHVRLRLQCEQWKAVADALEEAGRRDGLDTVMPALRWDEND